MASERRRGVDGVRIRLDEIASRLQLLLGVTSSIVVRSSDIDEKLDYATHGWRLAQACQALLENRRGLLIGIEDVALSVSDEDLSSTSLLIKVGDPSVQVHEIESGLFARLRTDLEAVLDTLPAAAAEPTIDAVGNALRHLELLPAARPIPGLQHTADSLGFNAASLRQPDHLDVGDISPLPDLPLRPGRPSYDSADLHSFPDGHYGAMMHNLAFRVELCAVEVCAAMIGHYPDCPWGLRYDLARQAWDEARHYRLFIDRARMDGIVPGALPIRFDVWDSFLIGRDLGEHLLIEQRIGEGLALERADDFAAHMHASGETELSAAYEFVVADEVVHVANGNKWLLDLYGSEQAIEEAEQAVLERLSNAGYSRPSPLQDSEGRYRSAAGLPQVRRTDVTSPE